MDSEVLVWIGRVTCGLFFLFPAYLLCTECTKKIWISKNEETDQKKRRYKRILSVSSMIIQIAVNVASFGVFISCFPITPCKYTDRPFIVFNMTAKLGLTFWQIMRLEYTSIVYKLYGSCLFYTLYASGFGLFCFSLLIGYGALGSYADDETHQYNGYQCVRNSGSDNILLTLIYLLWYLVWDWLVLGLYVHKMRKLTTDAANNPSINKVKMCLRKIIILTLIYEGIAFIKSFNFFVAPGSALGQFLLETKFTQSLDYVLIYLALYLMIDHNNDTYVKLSGWCTCGRKADKDLRPQTEAQIDEKSTLKGQTSMVTSPANNDSTFSTPASQKQPIPDIELPSVKVSPSNPGATPDPIVKEITKDSTTTTQDTSDMDTSEFVAKLTYKKN